MLALGFSRRVTRTSTGGISGMIARAVLAVSFSACAAHAADGLPDIRDVPQDLTRPQ